MVVRNLRTGKIGTLTSARIPAKGRLGDYPSCIDYLILNGGDNLTPKVTLNLI